MVMTDAPEKNQNICLQDKMTETRTIDLSPSTYLRGASFPLADANGNCVSFIDNAGNVQVHYTYDAFGGTVSSDGDMDDDFHFRFSSKYLDDETGLYYYGYRYRAPSEAGRFLRGVSPRRVRTSHPPVSSVGDMKEEIPNDMA